MSATTPRKGKPKKWNATEQIDNLLRTVYAKRLAEGRKCAVRLADLGKRLGWPKFALTKRARELGLCRVKEKPWSETEIELLAKYAHLSVGVVERKLRQAGFARTETAIHLKLNRTALRQGTDYFSATALAGLLGCDSHVVTRWIRLGYLKASPKGTERTPQQGGDSYLLHEADIRNFLLTCPYEYDFRKVTDQLWFLDVVTGGKVGGGYTR